MLRAVLAKVPRRQQAGEPAGPSTVDIQRAVTDGRHRLRTRRLAGVSAAAAVTALGRRGHPARGWGRAGERDQ